MAGMIGGTVSAATGGKFANGAITASIQWAFNAESQSPEEKALRRARYQQKAMAAKFEAFYNASKNKVLVIS